MTDATTDKPADKITPEEKAARRAALREAARAAQAAKQPAEAPEKPAQPETPPIGALVRLRSGGRPMTFVGVNEAGAAVIIWMNDAGDMRDAVVPPQVLVLA